MIYSDELLNTTNVQLSWGMFVSSVGGLSVNEAVLRECMELALSRGREIRNVIGALTSSIDR